MYFQNSFIPVFSFQLTLLNGLFVNKLTIVGLIDKTKLFLFSFFSLIGLPLCPSLVSYSFFFSLLK